MSHVDPRHRDSPVLPTRKALTVWQPWVSLLVAGIKRYETRGWCMRHRGPLLIHAAQRWGREQREAMTSPNVHAAVRDLRSPNGHTTELTFDGWEEHVAYGSSLPRSAIVGWVEVVGCDGGPMTLSTMGETVRRREEALGDFTYGRYAIQCERPHMLNDPIPCTGKQGIFVVPEELIQ